MISPGGRRGSGGPAGAGPLAGAADQLRQPLQGVLAVEGLAAEALGADHHLALRGEPPAGQSSEALPHLRAEGREIGRAHV